MHKALIESDNLGKRERPSDIRQQEGLAVVSIARDDPSTLPGDDPSPLPGMHRDQNAR